jgi:hypothetical protein
MTFGERMTADSYLQGILQRITAPTGAGGPGVRVKAGLFPTIQAWAGSQLSDVFLSGSYSKSTAIIGGTDVDLFISLKSNTIESLADIYNDLAVFMQSKGYTVRRQNVSLGIHYSGLKVDLVPGKRQSEWASDHSIYVSRQKTWQKTNVSTHAQVIGGSGFTPVIRLLKRWRNVHSLEFPSFALELAVLQSLNGRWTGQLASNVWSTLTFFRDRIASCALQDPANTNNNVADEMTVAEKRTIVAQASSSLGKQFWGEIIW